MILDVFSTNPTRRNATYEEAFGPNALRNWAINFAVIAAFFLAVYFASYLEEQFS
jgi:hypothetical protein